MRFAVALVALALAVRLACAVASFGTPLAFDAQDFDRHARSIAAGNGFPEAVHPRSGPSALRPPAYPLLLSGAYALSGENEAPRPWREHFATQPDQTGPDAGRVLQALIGTVVAALTGLVAFQLFGRRAGLVALTIAALYPPLVLLGLSLGADLLFVALELAAVAAALQARAGPRALRWALAAGALAGLAWLTRSNGYLLLPPLVVLVWTARPRLTLKALRAPAAVVAAALVAVAPWTVRNAIVLDAFVPVSTNAGYTLAGTYNDTSRGAEATGSWRPPQEHPPYARLIDATSTELEMSRELGRKARRHMRAHPGYVAEVAYCNTLRLAFLAWLSCGDERRSTVLGYVVEQGTSRTVGNVAIVSFALVALLGAVGAFTRAARRAPPAVWLVPALLLTTVFVLAANRFRAPVEPFVIILAALPLTRARQ